MNMGHVGSRTMTLGQISSKLCVQYKNCSFASVFMKLHQNVCLDNVSVKFENGSCGSKSSSLVQISLNSPVHCRGQSFDPVFMQLHQNCFDISVKFKYQGLHISLKPCVNSRR